MITSNIQWGKIDWCENFLVSDAFLRENSSFWSHESNENLQQSKVFPEALAIDSMKTLPIWLDMAKIG